MENLLGKVKRNIRLNNLLNPRDVVVVAVSGGADSVALLVALSSLGYDCIALHCNFHLRGGESMRDMRFVENLCARLGVELHIKDFDVTGHRKMTGESIEMACRTLRYGWFDEQVERNQAAAVAVGHHREDRIETFFLNLLRGTGLTGLVSMKPRNGNVIRPMLDCSRAEIEEFLKNRNLKWVEDCTNASDEFLRNRLRNRLLPMMEDLFPGANDAVLRTMSNLDENKRFYDSAIGREGEKFVNKATGDIDLRRLSCEVFEAGLLLFEMLRNEGFTRRQTDDMLRAAENSGGTFTTGKTHCRSVDHGILRGPCAAVVKDETVDISLKQNIEYPINIAVTLHEIGDFKPERNPDVVYLDASALDEKHRWQLRHRQRGDRMKPFGLKGSKLLSDVFAEARLSELEKRSAWLLTCDGSVVWAVGLRASSLFAVNEKTTQYVRLLLIKTN